MQWYERFPDEMAKEATAYKEKGLDFELNEAVLKSKGIVVFEGTVRVDDGQHQLRVIYSQWHPLVGVQVLDMSAVYPRHQNPRERNLCLPEWTPGETGAHKVLQAIELINLLSKGLDALIDREVKGPEPASAWYKYTNGCNALIPEPFTNVEAGENGRFKLILGPRMPLNGLTQGTLVEVYDSESGKKSEFDLGPLNSGYPVEGGWFSYPETPPFNLSTYDEWIDWFLSVRGKFRYHLDKQRKSKSDVEAFAIVYPEEGPGYRESRNQWQLLVRFRKRQPSGDCIMRPYILPMGKSYFRRAPFLEELARKRVVVAGLGAIGSVIAVELARAGVGNFVLIDHDVLRPGNVVRHASDLRAFGLPKVLAIQAQIQYINPECHIEQIIDRLGAPLLTPEEDHPDSIRLLSEAIQKSDILISTIADLPVEFCINDIAVSVDVPAIYAAVFYGTWGGQVFRSKPGGACIRCYQRSANYGNVPMPTEMPEIYFDGCNSPSFPGTGFDSSIVANLATRLVVQTLLNGNGYPDATYNLITWCSRGETAGEFPQISFDTIDRRSLCPACNQTKDD